MLRTVFRHACAAALLIALAAPVMAATTYYVSPSGSDSNIGTLSSPFKTIQQGITSAVDGDTVTVQDGIYTGPGDVDLDFGGKNIVVASANGPDTTIINCQGTADNPHDGFYFHNGEKASAVLDGFTIENAYTVRPSGAVDIYGSNPTIRNCIFARNYADDGGGGLFSQNDVTIINCVFVKNTAANYGGAICGLSANITAVNCTFTGNSITAADNGGGGAAFFVSGSGTFTNCILYGDTAASGNNEIDGVSIGGGINYITTACYLDDPLFVRNPDLALTSLDFGDLHLSPGSPCLGTGATAGAPNATIDGRTRPTPPSIGAYEADPRTVSTTTLATSLNPSVFGQIVTFTASVAGSGGTPTGVVIFTIDGTAQTFASLDGGAATYTTSSLALGTHTITARYIGDATFAANISLALAQNIVAPPPSAVSAVQVSPIAVYQGATTYGKVTLAKAAPAGGETVSLSTDNAAATAPATVLVPAGLKSATFSVSTVASVASDTAVSLTATAGGVSKSTSLSVLAKRALSGTVTLGGAGLANVTVNASATGTFLLTSTATPAASIPDNTTTGLSSSIVPKGTGTITGLVVGLDITHPNIGDLRVTLTGPDGTSIILYDQSGGTQQNLLASYPVLRTPVNSLSAFNGKSVQGAWTLQVQDLATGNVGILNGWSLTFTYQGTITGNGKTASDGTYTISSLKAGTYTVTPVLAPYSFSPASRTVSLGANASGVNFAAQAAVTIASLSVSPTSVKGGTATSTGTITLTGPAPTGGVSITQMSSDTSIATLAPKLNIPAGATSAKFKITTHAVTAKKMVTITSTVYGTSKTATITVTP